jgi:Mg-chelatase subunit ChlD
MRSKRLLLAGLTSLGVLLGSASCGGGSPDVPRSDSDDASAGAVDAGAGSDARGGGTGGGSASGGAASSSTGGTRLDLGGNNSGGRAGGSGLVECARATAQAELVPANLLFVIDTSGSMNCNPPDGDAELAARCARFPIQEDPARPSKWQVVKSALRRALGALEGAPQVNAGLMLFPREDACGVSAEPSVEIEPLDASHLDALSEALDGVTPVGETPLAGATILSYAHLAERLRAGTLTGNSFVILLTDGAETCAPAVLDPLVEKDVPNARGFDIRTFVIGAPGSEAARSLLSAVAWEGGTPASESCAHDVEAGAGDCHLDMTAADDFEAELDAALQAITHTSALSCEIAVPVGPAVDLNQVNVTFTPEGGDAEPLLNDSAPCADSNGWQYSEDSSKIVLCGEACQRVQREPGELAIVLGCATVKVR